MREGVTLLCVPRASLTASEPETHPIFFNPAGRVNRDISVALTSVTAGTSFCDVLAGTGARGVRIAKEVPRAMEVLFNDFNRPALLLAKKSATLNQVAAKCSFSEDEANHFLFSRYGRDKRFEYLDVDPFGSPSPFLAAALAASADQSVVSITATDTAVLCGVHPSVACRRYGSVSRRSEFNHETALRILLNFCARMAAMNDMGIDPIAAHSTRHYLRVYFRTKRSAAAADRSVRNSGFVSNCPNCGSDSASESASTVCGVCGGRTLSAGPLWLGRLTDLRTVERAAAFAEERRLTGASAILRSLLGVDDYPPYSYDIEGICSRLKVPSVPHEKVVEKLAEAGYPSMRQPFEKTGLKTDASHAEMVGIVRSVSSTSPKAD